MEPLGVSVKGYLIYFLFRCGLDVFKKNLCRPDFLDSEIVIWGLTSLTDFYKQIYRKNISFVQIMHLKLTFLSHDDIKSYY